MNVISDDKFNAWKSKNLSGIEMFFITPHAYYGKIFRARPGAFFITKDKICHWSYSPADTPLAICEKAIRIDIEQLEITKVEKSNIPLFWKFLFLFPKTLVSIETTSGKKHEIIIYDNFELIKNALKNINIKNKFI